MYVIVKVQAGAKIEKVEKLKENEYKISVKEPAERNMANKRIGEILAYLFKVNINQIRLINGHHSPSKIFSIML